MPVYPLYTESPYAFTEGKVLLADRCYVGPQNTAAPTAPLAGVAPIAPWVDLGSIDKSAVAISKAAATITPVETGLYQVLRAQIATKDGDATAVFTMVEYEPKAWQALTGTPLHTVGTATDGIYLGGTPIIAKALLLVGQNPVTGSEFHHYSPYVNIVYTITDTNGFKGIQVTATFMKWVPAGDSTNTARDYELVMFKGTPTLLAGTDVVDATSGGASFGGTPAIQQQPAA